MSLSLSSLLNPSSETDGTPPSTSRRDSQPQTDVRPLSAQEQLDGSTEEKPTPSLQQWHDHLDRARPSMSFEHRPGSSGFGDPYQLPLPITTADSIKGPSTLERYHSASRSPEQRRASVISPVLSNMTLPPLQGLGDVGHEPHGITSPHSGASLDNSDRVALSHAYIKQENISTPRTSSPPETRRSPSALQEPESHPQRQIAALKTENTRRLSSPLRESSVPMPSTETPVETASAKKRSAPAKTKKGTATSANTKKAPAAKKRKIDDTRSATPSARLPKAAALKGASGKATPNNSSPVPSTRSQSVDGDEEPDEEDDDEEEDDFDEDGDVYCLCRKPDTGTFMIGCDGTCDDWFHGKCVGIDERDKNLIDKYVCPNCTEKGIGRTSWKRICRRSGCRQAARIGKSKGGKKGSKYCSEECGLLHFQAMLARTRDREETGKHRGSRRPRVVEQKQRMYDDDLGARGGVLSVGEVKNLIDYSKTADDFKRLGEGVLSPPATPDGKKVAETALGDFTDTERQNIERISREKEEARRKHQLLKDRMKFVTMAKQAALRTATEKDLKPKDFCGYDSRIQWAEEQFGQWRTSAIGRRALEAETLNSDSNNPDAMDIDQPGDDIGADDYEICDRKKCARHLEWPKLAVDDVRFEMGDNGDRMRALDREERDVRERAALRAKKLQSGTSEGSVERHGTVTGPTGASSAALLQPDTGGESVQMDVSTAAEPRVIEPDVAMAE